MTVSTGLYLKHPHSRLIYDGRKSVIAQSSPANIEGAHILLSKENGVGLAYGLVTIGAPDTIDCDEFDSLFNLHRVTTKEREKWWRDNRYILLYPIIAFEPYAQPVPVEVPAGVQIIMPEVKFITDDSDKKISSEEQIMPWKASDAQSHTKLADTPAKQAQWAEIANDALERCTSKGGEVKECEASAIRQANSVVKKSSAKEMSLDEVSCRIRDAWYAQFSPNSMSETAPFDPIAPWVHKVFIDSVVTKDSGGIMYRYPLQLISGDVTFGDPVKVEAVYVPIPDSKEVVDPNAEEPVEEPEKSEDSVKSAGDIAEGAAEDTEIAKAAETSTEIAQAPLSEAQDKELAETAPDTEPEGALSLADIVPVVDVADKAGRRIRKSMLDRIKDAVATLKEVLGWAEEDMSKLPFVFKSKDGTKSYFCIWPTNSYFDRENEAFRIQALHDFVSRMDTEAVKSVAMFWHLPQTKFGNIIWQDVVEERFLVQIGEFDDTPIGNAFKEFFTMYPDGHPVIAPEGWGASHGYHYDPADRLDKVYDWAHSNESTVLPLSMAANILNPSPIVLGGKEMDDKRRDALQIIGDEMGLPLVELINSTAKAARDFADSNGVEHKMKKEDVEEKDPKDKESEEDDEEKAPDKKEVETAASAETEVQEDAKDTEVVKEVDANPVDAKAIADAVTASVVEQLGLKELSDVIQSQSATLKSLQERLDRLEVTDEKKVAEVVQAETPRFFSWQASKAAETVLTSDDGTLKEIAAKSNETPVAALVGNFMS